jgi:hypothetical protein
MFVKLRKSGLDFNVEDDVAGFLGVLMKTHEDGSVELTQVGLIDRVLSTLGLSEARPKDTPAEYGALPENKEGDPCNENWNYASVVGMMMYLASNSRPDISFAVHQCARFTHSPRHSHEIALKRIGRYLLGTRTKGLIMDPSESLGIEMFVDADFAGMHGYEHPENPMSVRSRTGYVICIAKCPVLWVSKLQPGTAMSTMMAEYIALSMGMRDLIPLKRLAEEVGDHMGLTDQKLATIHGNTVVHEDNSGALTLAKLEPGRSTPLSKFFDVKYHWFREQLKPRSIEVTKVATDFQLADIFTKGLRGVKFREMRRLLCGW